MNSEKRPRGPLQPHPAGLKDRGYRLYEQGKSNREIAKDLSIPLNTLARWSSKGKWKLRKQLTGHAETGLGALAPRKALNLEENKPVVVVNVALLHELSERRRARLLSRDTGRLESKPLQIADAVEVAKETGAQN